MLKSREEAAKIVASLTTLLHYPHEFSKFPPAYLDLIIAGGSNASCEKHWHVGQTCLAYAIDKCESRLLTGMKISAIFVALPAALRSAKKLKNNPGAWRDIFEKFARSTAYLALYGGVPYVMMCLGFKVGI